MTKTDSGKVVSFVLEALDAYTSKRVAASTGNSAPNNKDIVPIMLQQAIVANIDPFVSQLQAHFEDMQQNGREIRLTVRKWNNWDKNLESEVNGDEIRNHIYDWLQKTQLKGVSVKHIQVRTGSTMSRLEYHFLMSVIGLWMQDSLLLVCKNI